MVIEWSKKKGHRETLLEIYISHFQSFIHLHLMSRKLTYNLLLSAFLALHPLHATPCRFKHCVPSTQGHSS